MPKTMPTWVPAVLALALLASLALHGLAPVNEPTGPRALALRVEGEDTRPTLLIDFDTTMVPPRDLEVPLEPGLVRFDPPVAVTARFLTARRLEVRPLETLPPFTSYHVHFGANFADVLGRPFDAEGGAALAFTSRELGFLETPTPYVDERGRALCDLRLSGPVRAEALRRHLDLVQGGKRLDAYELEGANRRWRVVLPDVPAGVVTVVLHAGLASLDGPEALKEALRYEVRWDGSFTVAGTDVDGEHPRWTVTLKMNRVVATKDVASWIETDPVVEDLAASTRGPAIVLKGAFPPRRSVKVRLKAGLEGVGDLRLENDLVHTVTIPAPEPRLAFGQGGRTLSTAARPELEIEGLNVPVVEVTVHAVYPSNVVPLALGWTNAPRLSSERVEKRIRIDAPLDQPWTRRLDLQDVLGRTPRGVYRVRIGRPDNWWDRETRLIQVSDLAPVVRARPEGAVVFVTSIADGTPVADATVQVFDAKNQRLAEGRTDDDGIFHSGALAREPAVVTAARDDDLAYVGFDAHGVTHAPKDVEGRPPVQDLEAFAWVDRGAVRPGETAHVGAIVRTPGGVAPPEGLPVRARLLGPDRRVLRERAHRLDASGMLTDDVAFGLDARTGPYTLVVLPTEGTEPLGGVSFRVEAIVPDRIEPSVELPEGDLEAGGKVPVTLAAHLLTGEPAAGLPAKLKMRYRPVTEIGDDGFARGLAEDAPEPFETEVPVGTLDAEGRLRTHVTLPQANPAGVPLEASFELSVIDVSGRAAFARATRRVVPTGAQLAVAAPRDDAFTCEILARGSATVRGEAVLEHLTWRGAWVHDGERVTWRSERVPVELQRVPFAVTDGRGRVSFRDPGYGTYRVRVDAEGCTPAGIRFERWNGRTETGARDSGAPRLALAFEASKAAPGTEATLTVDAPFAGRGLLTVEASGAFEARLVDVVAGRSSLTVLVPDAADPTMYATLTVVRGAREAKDEPTRMIGAARIGIDRPARRLDVALETPPEVLPADVLRVRVRTSSPATLRVHAVDEGILRLTGFETPSPLARFEAPRRLDTTLADAHAALLQRMRFGGDDAEPGGGEGLARRLDPTAAKTILTVALASTKLVCDGEVEVELPLPAWEGRLRVFVVAANETSTGSAEAAVTVRAPVGLALHVPRAVAPGDEFDVVADVRGEGVALDIELEGLERLSGDRRLRVRALDAPGLARVRVTATDAAGNRTTREARLSIRPPTPFTVRHDVRTVAANGHLDEALPGRWLAGTAKARITIGAPGLVDALPAMERLLEYPYGCIEQTLSRAWPVLALAEVAALAHPEGGRAADTVGAAIDRLRLMQTAKGGLAMWPGGREPYPWGSAYAADFLLAAKDAGRVVPDDLLDPLLDWLEGRLRADQADPYTARVLARAGRPVAAFLDALERGNREKKGTGTEDRAHLAAAWLLAGETERAEALLDELGDPDDARRELGGSLASPTRVAATVLGALLSVRPDDERVPALRLRLTAAARDAVKNTTQENAAVLLVLAKAERLRQQVEGDTEGWVEVGGRTVRFDGRTPCVVDVENVRPWSYRLHASGPVTAVIRTEGVPLEAPEAPAGHGLVIARRIEGAKGPMKQGEVYRVVLEGTLPAGARNILVTDLLPGGLEIEKARGQAGSLKPDRVEPRDDRVLFFRTDARSGAFRQTYLVRAVTPGTYRLPPPRVELLYDPLAFAEGASGKTVEVER